MKLEFNYYFFTFLNWVLNLNLVTVNYTFSKLHPSDIRIEASFGYWTRCYIPITSSGTLWVITADETWKIYKIYLFHCPGYWFLLAIIVFFVLTFVFVHQEMNGIGRFLVFTGHYYFLRSSGNEWAFLCDMAGSCLLHHHYYCMSITTTFFPSLHGRLTTLVHFIQL